MVTTPFIAATARGDIPTGSIEYETIFVVGMTLFGLVYRALPAWMTGDPPLQLARTHFWLTTIGVIGVCLNGTIGYEALGILQPDRGSIAIDSQEVVGLGGLGHMGVQLSAAKGAEEATACGPRLFRPSRSLQAFSVANPLTSTGRAARAVRRPCSGRRSSIRDNR